jgi:hypothetical protein
MDGQGCSMDGQVPHDLMDPHQYLTTFLKRQDQSKQEEWMDDGYICIAFTMEELRFWLYF